MRSCICEKRMLEQLNEGTCLWCGYGDIWLAPVRSAVRSGRALPRDLGELQRTGTYPDPRLDNVIDRHTSPRCRQRGVLVHLHPQPDLIAECTEEAA